MEVAPDCAEFIACLTAHGVEFAIVDARRMIELGVPPCSQPQPSVDPWSSAGAAESEVRTLPGAATRAAGRIVDVGRLSAHPDADRMR
jgi:hypothetical protein